MPSKVEDFWKFINARHSIYLKRKAKQPKPWSDDPIFQEWKFTNVFRELDRGTISLRRMLRTLYIQYTDFIASPQFTLNTFAFRSTADVDNYKEAVKQNYIRNQFITCILYRMFNWHENAKFGPITNQTAWWQYLRQEQSIGNQIFGDAHTLPSQKGEEKLVTFERVGREIVSDADDLIAEIQEHNTLKYAAELLSEYKHIGPFIAYEFVCDLRYTDILRNATDVATWCNIGPGAVCGLERMGRQGNMLETRLDSIIVLYNQSYTKLASIPNVDELHWIYKHVRFLGKYVTKDNVVLADGDKAVYPYWELREIEHCLCEFDKYERIRLGQGNPKDKFDGMPSETQQWVDGILGENNA